MRYETISIRSMLGLRFRDATTERPVTEGLSVRVRRPTGTGPSTRAVRAVSGAYVAQGLDGLRPHERSPGDPPDPVPEPRRRDYHVAVHDRRGRFVPALFSVRLPYAPQETLNGLYPVVDPPSEEEAEGNGPPEPTVYLFSAVQRSVPAGQAVVYADLVAEENGARTPAAHAVLEVRHSLRSGETDDDEGDTGDRQEVWFGVADADGRVAVQFPHPQVRLEELSSDGNGPGGNGPPGRGRGRSGRRPGEDTGSAADREGLSLLTDQRWQVEVRVRYDPSVLRTPGRARRPLLASIFNQGAGTLYETSDGTGTEVQTHELSVGAPLVLRTQNRSELQIAAPPNGGSP
jgi:hypothetical protein